MFDLESVVQASVFPLIFVNLPRRKTSGQTNATKAFLRKVN